MDGQITKEEVPQVAGLTANFRFASDVDVDIAGTKEGDIYKWNLSGPYDGDYDVPVVTKPVAGSWYASDFPTGVYSVLLGKQPAEALGVLRPDENALTLLGVVSNSDTEPETQATNMQYDKAVHTLEFPLHVGAHWVVTDAQGSGTLAGYAVPLYGEVSDEYDTTVDQAGALTTPYGVFPVLRVVTTFTRSSWNNSFLRSSSITVAFVTECAGTIAKVTSEDGVTDLADFTHAAEIQRIAIAP